MNEEQIIQELTKKFNIPAEKIRSPRKRRIFCEVDYAKFEKILDFCIKEIKFNALCAITGFDEGINLGAMYHMANDSGIVLNIKISVNKSNPVIRTVTSIFPSADAYERELVDLFGFQVEGLAKGNRYPLTDDWPKDEYPLRKDWKLKEKGSEAQL